MSSLFINILRQVFKTFDRANQSAFGSNFDALRQLTASLTIRDMHLDLDVFSEEIFSQPDKAPCTFMHIYENREVSMSIFIMRGGYTMPLHDHPMMHGILKGLYGKLEVISYTQKLNANDVPMVYDEMVRHIDVIADEPKIVSPETGCAVLTPHERNFHQITALGGVAAFFDILSPPYDTDIPIYGRRKCHFYQALHNHSTDMSSSAGSKEPRTAMVAAAGNALRLQRIPVPLSYYCDTGETPEELVEHIYIYCTKVQNS